MSVFWGGWGVIRPYGTHSGQQIKTSYFFIQITVLNSIFTSNVWFQKSENQWKTYVNILVAHYMLVNMAECTLVTGFKSIPEYTFEPVLINQIRKYCHLITQY